MQPHFPPGDGIYYSEVGFNLLGLIIESVTGDDYHEVLHESLFEPLSMSDSYLLHVSEPEVGDPRQPSNFFFDDEEVDVRDYRSFSGWFAGGNTVNTAEDLFRFHRALVSGELVSRATLDAMRQWRRLSIGIDYGYGVVRFRALPLAKRYHVWGGIGATNSLMFYNPATETYVVGTFNRTKPRGRAFRFVFNTVRTISKIPTGS